MKSKLHSSTENIQKSQRNEPETLPSINKDEYLSLAYRISEMENTLSRKIDRKQFMLIFEQKANITDLNKISEEIRGFIEDRLEREAEKNKKMQQCYIKKLSELKKGVEKNVVKELTKKNKVEPQELYLESNETMFSLIIEQINSLKDQQNRTAKSIESKNKKVISLNNEVCHKIESLQHHIQANLLKIDHLSQQLANKNFNLTSSTEKNRFKHETHHGLTMLADHSQVPADSFEFLKLDLLSKSIEVMQKQLVSKLNIRDVQPFFKNEAILLEEQMSQLREFVEENIESTKKILMSQAEINEQICNYHKRGWWYSYAQENNFCLWGKEMHNLMPEVFSWQSEMANCITVLQQGSYLIRAHRIQTNVDSKFTEDCQQDSEYFEVLVGMKLYSLKREVMVRIQKGAEVRLISKSHSQIYLSLQKI